MAKDLQSRIDAWKARMQGEALSPAANRVLDLTNPIPSASFNEFVNRTTSWFAYETAIRALLGGAGVPTIQYPFYLCFGRELWQLGVVREIALAGYSGAAETAILKAKWVTRGLNSGTLDVVIAAFVSATLPPAPTPTQPPNGQPVVTLTPTLVVMAESNGDLYNFRVFYQDALVVEEPDAPSNSWTVTPALTDDRVYTWDARVQIGGIWGPRFSPRWSFSTDVP